MTRRTDTPSLLPRGLIPAVLALWGWSNHALEFAVPMALLYELAPLVSWRWRFTSSDFNRLVDLTAVLFVGTAVYQFDLRGAHGVYGVLVWLPALLYVLLLGQRYSERGRIGLGSLFLSIRRALARGDMTEEAEIDFAFAYFVACLLSAVGGPARGTLLTVGVAVLLLWGGWYGRSPRFSPWHWGAVAGCALILGIILQFGMVKVRGALEPLVMDVIREFLIARRDPFRTHTAVGEIGRLKLSERIEMRVWPVDNQTGDTRPEDKQKVPHLLQQATYRVFSRNSWLSGQQGIETVQPTDGGLTWKLRDPAPEDITQTLELSRYLSRGRGVLALPSGSVRLRQLAVEALELHSFGAVRIRNGPDLARFLVDYIPGQVHTKPDSSDVRVPREYDLGIRTALHANHLAGSTDLETVRRIQTFFLQRFNYSLDAGERLTTRLPIVEFLNDLRSGHCEYFATASVLLLRAAGIPARYAVGYAVSEWSHLDNAFVVRRRHAHAWAVAYVAGRWIEIDTTPPGWVLSEAADTPWWLGLYDLGAWLRHLYSSWRWRTDVDDDGVRPWVLLVALPLVLLLLWRLRGQRVRREDSTRPVSPQDVGPRSEFLAVQEALKQRELGANDGETLTAWLQRLEHSGQLPHPRRLLDVALPLHQRLRFDPVGLSSQERVTLRLICKEWVHDLDAQATDMSTASPR
ncbi:MAG: transglutaminase domain-containing protein [Chromatiales bacterium]|nr:transglutaminase domain-containing protein [Chromatiales bacterium]